jgi:hypothetical protein
LTPARAFAIFGAFFRCLFLIGIIGPMFHLWRLTMPRPSRAASFFAYANLLAPIAATALAACACTPAHAAPQHTVNTDQAQIGQTISSQDLQNLPLNSDAYGPGAYRLINLVPGGVTTKWQDFDGTKTLREDDIFQYSGAPGGASVKTEEQRDYYSPNGTIQERTITDWNLRGGLDSYRFETFDFHGNKTSDHTTKYQLDLHMESGWSPTMGRWQLNIPYNPTSATSSTPAQPGTSMLPPSVPQVQTVGFLFPRDYHPGDMLTGSLWKSSYAEAFKGVPGLSEYTFPIQTYNLPNGLPNFAGLEMGVKGYGYVPVQSDGRFSLHLPDDWKGPLVLQARDPDLGGSIGSYYGNLPVGDPVAAPEFPHDLLPPKITGVAKALAIAHLIDLWNEAYNLELEYTDAEDDGAPDGVLDDIDCDLHDVYEDIDHLTSMLPTEDVVKLAHELADETRAISDELRKDTLTDEQEAELREYDGWANFLDDEADECKYWSFGDRLRLDQLYWTAPVLSQGRLGALRGPFSGDDYGNYVRLDNLQLPSIAATPDTFYFMPPDGLTAGLHNFQIGGFGTPQTILPVFYMTLTMWADQTNLHKGQSTTYHLKLTGLNGLPGSAWNSPFFPSDLVSPSDLQGSSPGSSRTGTITLTITNESPGVISMKNVYTVLDAQAFAPSGTFQVDGGVGAILDGGFSILGVARAFLQPEAGYGSYTYPPASQDSGAPSTHLFDNNNWNASPNANLFSNYAWNVSPTAPIAPSSSASTPGLPSCGVPDPPPTILLPLNDLYMKSCMGAYTTSLYNQAPFGGGAPSDSTTAPKPSQEEAENRAAATEQAVKDWKDRCDKEAAKTSAAWMDGYNGVSQAAKDALAKASKDDYHALMDEESARSLIRLNPTDENRAKLAAARARSAGTHEAYNDAESAVRNQFTDAQRAAWHNANNEWKSAEYYRAQAEEELRDARDALGRQFPLQLTLKYMF